MAGVAIIATLALAGCADSRPNPIPTEGTEGVSSARNMREQKVELSDGRTVLCLFWRTDFECFPEEPE